MYRMQYFGHYKYRNQYMDFESTLTTLGRSLQEMRQRRGLRQEDVAFMAGLPRLKVIQVEAGRPSVSAAAYAKVAAALGSRLTVELAMRPTSEEIGDLIGDERG